LLSYVYYIIDDTAKLPIKALSGNGADAPFFDLGTIFTFGAQKHKCG